MRTQKGIASVILVIVIIVLVVVAGFFAYQYFSTKTQPVVQTQQNQNQQQQTVNQQTNNVQPINQTAGWKTYINNDYGFSIQYPDGAKITDVDMTGGRNVSIQIPVSGKNSLTGKTLEIAIVTQQYEHNGPALVPASCNADTFYNSKTSNVVLNGMTFIKGNVSGAFGGMQSSSYAIEYCIMRGDKSFRLTSLLSSSRNSQLPSFNIDEESKVLDQMISTFKFTK
jgi:hypothetical protein